MTPRSPQEWYAAAIERLHSLATQCAWASAGVPSNTTPIDSMSPQERLKYFRLDIITAHDYIRRALGEETVTFPTQDKEL